MTIETGQDSDTSREYALAIPSGAFYGSRDIVPTRPTQIPQDLCARTPCRSETLVRLCQRGHFTLADLEEVIEISTRYRASLSRLAHLRENFGFSIETLDSIYGVREQLNEADDSVSLRELALTFDALNLDEDSELERLVSIVREIRMRMGVRADYALRIIRGSAKKYGTASLETIRGFVLRSNIIGGENEGSEDEVDQVQELVERELRDALGY